MSSRLYYLMALLPPLPPLGEIPPMDAAELQRIIEQERIGEARLLAEAFNFESQLMRAASLKLLGYSIGDTSGTYSFSPNSPPVVLELFLKDPQEMGEDAWFSQLWTEHLDFIDGVGKTVGSKLLCQWARWEKSLREQLVLVRLAEGFGGEPKESSKDPWDHTSLIAEWRSASDPMNGERILDQARMNYIESESRRYSFSIDELAAYFLKLGFLARHAQMDREEGKKILEEVTTL